MIGWLKWRLHRPFEPTSMASKFAFDAASETPVHLGQVVSFRAARGRSTPPRQPFEHRLARAGLAIAAHLIDACMGTTPDGENVHAGTVIGILATMAAEAGLQAASINRREALPAAVGGWINGGVADAILFKGVPQSGVTTVWDFVAAAADEMGVPDSLLPNLDLVLARAEAHIGEKPYPVLTVPPAFRPRAVLRAAAARHRHTVHAFCADEALCTPHEQALALGAAIAQVIRTEDAPDVLATLAAEVLVGAARLAPMPYAVS
jgi:hypothetical protein